MDTLRPRRSDDRVVSTMRRLALVVAAAVALAIPLGYAVHEYGDLDQRIGQQALVRAGTLTALISGNPRLWSYQVQVMEELLERAPVPLGEVSAKVYDAEDRVLLGVGQPPAWPVFTRSSPLHDSGRVVGRIEIARSLRAFLFQTALAALLGLLLGGAVFGLLRRMSLALEAEQAALRRSEDRFRLLFDRASDGIMIVSPEGKLVAANESFARMHGYSVEEMLHMSLKDLDTPETLRLAPARMERVLAGESATFEVEHYHKNGRVFPLEISASLIVSDGEAMIQCFHRDITERVQLESQLRESQKMEALGTLAGGVAHDFNNIVAAILGNLELARQDVGPAHTALESLAEIGKASRRAKDLVQQILAFGRRQGLSRKPISLAPVAEESARLLRTSLTADVTLNIECAAETPTVLADASQIQQVLLNLCSNAWQAMRGRAHAGVIEVRLEAHTVDEAPHVEQERRLEGERVLLRPGRYACLSVRDNGPGMDVATRSHIFEPFFTTKPMGEGTGLGLAVVHGIVQAHEASIAVQSEPGKGTTFRIYFPAVDPAVQAVAEEEPRPLQQNIGDDLVLEGTGKHVLYLDDDEAIVYLMTRLLERQGYRVSGYTDALEALAAVRAEPAQFDLAVTDHNMPGMSGLEVATALREIRADLPVAVATGYITDELRDQAPAAGVRELIFKPNTVEELCETVARLAHTAGKISKHS